VPAKTVSWRMSCCAGLNQFNHFTSTETIQCGQSVHIS
jgi:hypothetical protein